MDGFNPERLREIRIAKKMTLAQLAKELGITKQAVSKYECGKSIPSSDVINKLIRIMDIPIQFLTKKSIEHTGADTLLFFRTLSSTTKTQMEFAEIISRWGYEILHGMNSIESIDEINLPEFEASMSIPQKACFLREYWGIGSLPVENMISLLEKNGIFVLAVSDSEIKTDAYSRVISDIPIVVLNESKGTAVRQRFSLAHELGHLVLHRHLTRAEFEVREKEIEDEASLFASNFLMPPANFSALVVSPKLDRFLELKREWRVSIAAMIYHCRQLEIIDDKKTRALQMQLSKRWGRKTEPLDDELSYEKPVYLSEHIKKEVVDKISFGNLFDAIRLPIDAIERICYLPEGYFSEYNIGLNYIEEETEYKQLSLFSNGGIYNVE